MRADTDVLIRLSDIGMHYQGPPEVTALRDVSMSIAIGDYVALTGPSGSGKSTLLNILGLLARPTSGTYLLNGVDVGRLDERDRAGARGHWVGTIFQSFHLLNDRSATENVMMGSLYGSGAGLAGGSLRSRAHECLSMVGLGHRKDAGPATLSGGERQRVAIARALFAEPDILLCDEPTGNLDSISAAGVMALFDELNTRGQTLVVITHSADVAAQARRQMHVLDGSVTERL